MPAEATEPVTEAMSTVATSLARAIELVPAGRWAVGVSGGADSVALLSLLRDRSDVSLHVVHLDHQTRADESAQDARFVAELATSWKLPCTVARRDEVETRLVALPTNVSARYRALRLALFREVVAAYRLNGVMLAHHADDQAETVLHRLLRGAGTRGVAGMSVTTSVHGLTVVRPLLGIRATALREYLRGIGQTWREDASNASPDYFRNRLRMILREQPALTNTLLDLAAATNALKGWSDSVMPQLPACFRPQMLRGLPEMVAASAVRAWLIQRGAPMEDVNDADVARIVRLATDAAAPARQSAPGGLLIRRRAGAIFAERTADIPAKPPPSV